MGTNYRQYCIIGQAFDSSELKVVDSKGITEKQPKYNTRTGEIESYQIVTVKEEVYHYELMGQSVSDLYSFDFSENGLDTFVVDDTLYVGRKIAADEDFGRVELIYEEIQKSDIDAIFDEMSKYLQDPCLFLVPYVG